MSRNRSDPMPVKYWSSAGLMLTYWCNAQCASCYLCCAPQRKEWMSIPFAIRVWRELIEASPHGCRVHLSGGEPFGDWTRLIMLCHSAAKEGLGPLEKIETNAFWATGAEVVRERLVELDRAGMGKVVISADPYHQQFVPIERCRLAVRVAEDVLGADRVQVRWRDWLAEGFDTDGLSAAELMALQAGRLGQTRDRMSGRAAWMLAGELQQKPLHELADNPCREALLRSRHVHVDWQGLVMPGTCAGIVLGVAGDESMASLWRILEADGPRRPILGPLLREGPAGLIALATSAGFRPRATYASKCHLCWDIRCHLSQSERFSSELSPGWMYSQSTSRQEAYNEKEGDFA